MKTKCYYIHTQNLNQKEVEKLLKLQRLFKNTIRSNKVSAILDLFGGNIMPAILNNRSTAELLGSVEFDFMNALCIDG